jgi:hypothetical protein
MINSFSQYLVEEERVVYFTFGRMNPPTIGHGKLLDKLSSVAGRNPYKVYLSQTHDSAKNPLSYSDKVKHTRKMFPKHARSIIVNTKIKTAIEAITDLYNQGFRKVVMVVGQDRVMHFDALLNKYNGKEARHGLYNFSSIKVISAGERDPDAEGVEGMSASKQREHAKDNDFATFSQGVPTSMPTKEVRKLFNDIRKGMGLSEEKQYRNHIALKPVSNVRENYVSGNLFSLGDNVTIKSTGAAAVITTLGSNYLVVESEGKRYRKWLSDVELTEAFKFTQGQKHRLDPNLSLKQQLVHAKKYVDRDNDGDVDASDKDTEADIASTPKDMTKHMMQKYKKEKGHTKAGVAFEANQPEEGTDEARKRAKKITPGETCEGLWDNIHARRKKGLRPLRPGEKGYPKTLNIEQNDMERAREKIAMDKKQSADMIAREKQQDKQKHDRLLDTARRAVMLRKNKGIKP